jgi:hypothetical protein
MRFCGGHLPFLFVPESILLTATHSVVMATEIGVSCLKLRAERKRPLQRKTVLPVIARGGCYASNTHLGPKMRVNPFITSISWSPKAWSVFTLTRKSIWL